MANTVGGLTETQAAQKRALDIFLSFIGLLLTWWLILVAWAIASLDTRSNGLFIQERVGMNGKIFTVLKIKTMRPECELTTTVTQSGDSRITRLGRLFRKSKIDELPQFWNVLIGDMSFVGPRPDVPGFADRLVGEERLLLTIRPGITGPATLRYRDEEKILSAQSDPEGYNRDIIWPNKVKINLEYIRSWRLADDIKYIWWTIIGVPPSGER